MYLICFIFVYFTWFSPVRVNESLINDIDDDAVFIFIKKLALQKKITLTKDNL